MDHEAYLKQTAATRDERMRWWHDARFGMFVHWGLYSQLGRHEWVMKPRAYPHRRIRKVADSWRPKERPRARMGAPAAQAGMKYMVMTTKHHEGFCLWDTKQTDYNAVKHGPGRAIWCASTSRLAAEFGLKVGFYYSLMDWHHPDGALCATDEAARATLSRFHQGLACASCAPTMASSTSCGTMCHGRSSRQSCGKATR